MWVTVEGLKLYYTDVGPRGAPTVVLLHAFPLSSEMWDSQIHELMAEYRVVACDMRGFGLSEVGDGLFTMEFLVDDLVALLDEVGIERAVLCGLSAGGYVSLRTIEREPDRLLGLVLCDTKSEADSNDAKLGRTAAMKAIRRDGVRAFADGFLRNAFSTASMMEHDLVNSAKKIIEKNSTAGMCGMLLALAGRTDTTSFLQRIHVPTLIMVGEEDKVTPPDRSRQMHTAITASELQIIPGAGHLSNLENPSHFNSCLLGFLKRNFPSN